jgi:hypothetical protein
MKTRYTGEIELGDFILVSSGYGMSAGFYVGQGKSGTLQYYNIHTLSNWWDKIQQEDNLKRTSPFKDYINTPNEYRIAKLHPDNLAADHLERYYKSLEALKLLKLRK